MSFSKKKSAVWWGLAWSALITLCVIGYLKWTIDDRLPGYPEELSWVVTDVGQPFQQDSWTKQKITVKDTLRGHEYRITTYGHACFTKGESVRVNGPNSSPDRTYFEVVANPWCEALVEEPGQLFAWIRDGNSLLVIAFVLALVIGTVGGLMLWLLPAYIAHKRQHNNFIPILIVDLCVGWTVLGMIACLAWAFSDNVKTVRIERA